MVGLPLPLWKEIEDGHRLSARKLEGVIEETHTRVDDRHLPLQRKGDEVIEGMIKNVDGHPSPF